MILEYDRLLNCDSLGMDDDFSSKIVDDKVKEEFFMEDDLGIDVGPNITVGDSLTIIVSSTSPNHA